jgi:hypothetical protein
MTGYVARKGNRWYAVVCDRGAWLKPHETDSCSSTTSSDRFPFER